MKASASFPLQEIIERVGHHLQIDRRIQVKWKGVQLMETDTTCALMGINADIFSLQMVKKKSDIVLDRCESEMYGDMEVQEKLHYDMDTGNPVSPAHVIACQGVEWRGTKTFRCKVLHLVIRTFLITS